MNPIVIDPGHGGDQPQGKSTPYGSRAPAGTFEKDVCLDIAHEMAHRLGSHAMLTRSGDQNLPLGSRVATARQHAAPVFLSIHTGSEGVAPSLGRVWIHEDAGPDSLLLAEDLANSLMGPAGPAQVQASRLAVLDPNHHALDTAACLVEVGDLSDPRQERWFLQGGAAHTADALSRGLRRYMGRAGDRWGTATANDWARVQANSQLAAQHQLDTLLRGGKVSYKPFEAIKAALGIVQDIASIKGDASKLGAPSAPTTSGSSNFVTEVKDRLTRFIHEKFPAAAAHIVGIVLEIAEKILAEVTPYVGIIKGAVKVVKEIVNIAQQTYQMTQVVAASKVTRGGAPFHAIQELIQLKAVDIASAVGATLKEGTALAGKIAETVGTMGASGGAVIGLVSAVVSVVAKLLHIGYQVGVSVVTNDMMRSTTQVPVADLFSSSPLLALTYLEVADTSTILDLARIGSKAEAEFKALKLGDLKKIALGTRKAWFPLLDYTFTNPHHQAR